MSASAGGAAAPQTRKSIINITKRRHIIKYNNKMKNKSGMFVPLCDTPSQFAKYSLQK